VLIAEPDDTILTLKRKHSGVAERAKTFGKCKPHTVLAEAAIRHDALIIELVHETYAGKLRYVRV